MSDVSEPNDGKIIPNRLPVPYVTQYTDRTHTLSPFLVPGIAAGAFLMVEWGTLRWMDHAPTLVWLANTAIGVCILIVIALKDWLSFKNHRYFPVSLTVLLIAWGAIVGFAYYLDASSQTKVVAKEAAEDDRETVVRHLVTALSERDAARKDLAATKRDLEVARMQAQPQLPQPSAPEDQKPVSWQPDYQMTWDADQKIPWIRFIGVATDLAHMKEAYVISTLTGRKEPLAVANPTNFNERWKVDQVEAIPTGAQVILVFEPKPMLPLPDFIRQWGAFEFHVVYDDKEYVKVYSQAYINSKMQREMPGFGPHVTRRIDK